MAEYPYCWAWCCLRGDFAMLDRAMGQDRPPQQACYFDDAGGRWILFYELPAEERARILDPAFWEQIEARRWDDAPTRADVGLGPVGLKPDVLAALTHRGSLHSEGRAWTKKRPPGRLGASRPATT